MAELKHFTAKDTIISADDSKKILQFFYGTQALAIGQPDPEDKAFAQALLIEAVEASVRMGYVEKLFNNFFGKIPASFGDVNSMIKGFVKDSLKHWWKSGQMKDIREAKIYESVRATIASNFKTVWTLRLQTGEYIY